MKPLDPLAIGLDGTHLVEASAGTGKTFTIAFLVLRLVAEKRVPVSRILVVTYTNAATAELRSRVRGRLREALRALESGGQTGDELLDSWVAARRGAGHATEDARRLEEEVRGFDEAPIFTIHGFCQRVLQENAFESRTSFATELLESLDELREETLLDVWEQELAARDPRAARLVAANPGLEVLRALASTAVANRGAVLLGGEGASGLDRELLDARDERRRAAADVWRAERESILSALTSPVLKQNVYRPETIRSRWRPALDAFCDEPESGLDAELLEKLTVTCLTKGTRKHERTPQHRFFQLCTAWEEAEGAVAAAADEDRLRLKRRVAERVREEIEVRKARARVWSFEDLLVRVERALAEEGSGEALAARLRQRYEAALVDEFQDTDPVQIEIFRRVFHGSAPLYVIGDPKQSIYSFRGADLHAYQDARRELGAREHTLASNFRSDRPLVDAVSALFAARRHPFANEDVAFPQVRARREVRVSGFPWAPLRLLFVRRDGRTGSRDLIIQRWSSRGLPRLVAAEVSKLLASGARIRRDSGEEEPVSPGDVAVLCRTNQQLAAMREALRALGVPAVIQAATSVFADEEAEEMERIMTALADPSDPRAIRAALATSALGVGGDALFALLADERGWDDWVSRFRDWHEVWARRGFAAAFRHLLEETRAYGRLAASAAGERRLTNFLHLAELASAEESTVRRGPLALVEWLRRMREDDVRQGELAEDAARIRLESDVQAVKLVTIHKSKGLEWPIVLCPDLWGGSKLQGADKSFPRFHRPGPGGRMEMAIDLGTARRDEHERAALLECLQERLRLLYVALTRAKHHCSVVWGHFNEAETSALAHLLHGVEEQSIERTLESTNGRFAGLSDEAMLAELGALAAAAGGAIAVEDVRAEPAGRPYRPPARPATSLEPLTFAGSVRDDWRLSSFSALVAGGERLSREDEEGIDRDRRALPPEGESAGGGREVPLHDFPAGANAGNAIHGLLERVDFAASADEIAARASELLPRFGLGAERARPLAGALERVLATDLPAGGGTLALREVGAARRRSEMEFVLPVATDRGRLPPLTAAALGRAFSEHGARPCVTDYARRAAALGFKPLAGHLKGYVDLVFEHGGRWWVLDWKSNHLGKHAGDYAPARLDAEMVRNDYVLQAHLYAVGLHRHLALRLRGYDYDRHFGGVLYLFVRGVHPEHPPGTGVWFDRPPAALVDGLSRCLGETEAAA